MAGNLVLGLGQLVLSLEHGPYGTSLQDQSSEAKPVFPTALSNRLWSAWLKNFCYQSETVWQFNTRY